MRKGTPNPDSDPLDGVDLAAVIESQPVEDLPPAGGEPMVKTSIKLPVALYQAIDAEARRTGVGRSTLIRQFVEAGLADRAGDQVMIPLTELKQVLAALAQRKHPAA
jgi:Ribbon-helix-helix protein, copG family